MKYVVLEYRWEDCQMPRIAPIKYESLEEAIKGAAKNNTFVTCIKTGKRVWTSTKQSKHA